MSPFRRPPACLRCNDTRRLTKSARAHESDTLPCDRCGNFNDDEYQRFRQDAWVRSHEPPTISQIDLTPEEFVVYNRMREQNPQASKTTVLMWMEGQRYDPSKDEGFLAVAREEFKKWQARP